MSELASIRPAGVAAVEEAEAFLAAHPDITAFDLVLVDANGIARGKIIRRHELLPLFRSGRHLPGSILGLDVTGEDVEETGLVWADGDADRRAWPIAGSLVRLPWTSPPRGEVRLALYELDASPMAADPRHALARRDNMLKAEGYHPVLAYELEFYLLDRQRDADGGFQALRLPLSGERPEGIQVYGVSELDRLEPFIDAVYQGAEVQGLPVETLISEYAEGQFELTLRHGAALRAADDLVMLKRLIRAVALRHGMMACFMAKPFADRAGSGMHVHASLNDGNGRNLFADEGGVLVAPLRHAVAGLLETMDESMLVFAPHLNSWRRFSAQSYAPTAPTWGFNNRSVAVRIPAGAPGARHLEQRAAGIDANPYLVGATVLAGIHRGISSKSDPGPEARSYRPGASDELPPDWRSAISAASSSAFLRDALGERLHHVFLALKRAEYRRFAAEVTALERKIYGESV
ncbi:glutamine synthetase family protein [Sinorhizobium sp. BG8]|uniref:glutamine synthetase family protein n=1 Tax=Sinorhizobium sp. BG8 TaxID=2613773 RepID=UPI00193CD576|nr:glutamine synthetase family protein [Sinorhizobium sp. BG8]QRM57355.1 glutamine synthetase [Sinorhizobium sp. BG8]